MVDTAFVVYLLASSLHQKFFRKQWITYWKAIPVKSSWMISLYGEQPKQNTMQILPKFLIRIREINLKLKWDKCKVKVREVGYVGHLLTAEGLKPEKV